MTATLLPFPPAASQRLVSTVKLLHLDGRPFASAGFLPGNPGDAWAWIVETVAHELECPEDAVHASEEEDWITVDGIPCYQVVITPSAASRVAFVC